MAITEHHFPVGLPGDRAPMNANTHRGMGI